MQDVVAELNEILSVGFDADSSERNDFVENFKMAVKKETKEYVVERSKNLNEDVLRKFKLLFERDDRGRVRDWVAMEVPAIKELWTSTYVKLEVIFDKFRSIDINWD